MGKYTHRAILKSFLHEFRDTWLSETSTELMKYAECSLSWSKKMRLKIQFS